MSNSPTNISQGFTNHEQNLIGLHILLADDAIDNQKIVNLLLSKAGAHVQIAPDGAAAVQQAQNQSFDIILMDMEMPNMDGYQATDLLRKQGLTCPILALTAHSDSPELQRCLKVGCNATITKPVNRVSLIKTITQNLDNRDRKLPDHTCSTDPTQNSSNTRQIIESEFADDPDMAEIIDQFVDSLPEKIRAMQQMLAAADYDNLQRLAHQLKGAGGGYGYPCLTENAKSLEQAAQSQDRESAHLSLSALDDLCQAIVPARKTKALSHGE